MSYRLSFIKFMIIVWVFLNVLNNVQVSAITDWNCDDVNTKSYCLDCLTYAVCLPSGGYLPVLCPSPTVDVCVESVTAYTATCGPPDEKLKNCTCSTFPSLREDYYDPEDKYFLCTNVAADPLIECKNGNPVNTTSYTCDSAPPPNVSTAPPPNVSTPPPQECNNGLEFMCLGCNYYQLCLSDGTSQVHDCGLNEQCNLPARQCIDTTFTPFVCFIPDTPNFQEDPNDCRVYHYCDGKSEEPLFSQTCPEGQVFEYFTQSCAANEDKWAICSYDCSSDATTNAPKSTTSTTGTTTTAGSITTVTTTTPNSTPNSTPSPSPSPCPCPPAGQTCAIDCKNYYYCYEDPPGTYTLVAKTCPYDFNFNPTTAKCELGPCVQTNNV